MRTTEERVRLIREQTAEKRHAAQKRRRFAQCAGCVAACLLLIAGLGYWLNRRFQVRHDVAGPSAMIGASNFFELAVAVAIVLYGFTSGAALATVVGVLIEVPVMLWLVRSVNRSRDWYNRALTANRT